jgi:ABC-2 type transport system ATP-binding protein
MNENIIEVKSLTHYYSDFKALDNISFTIPDKKIIGLLGPNGAGKTTLINILSTLLKPSKGEVKVFGFDILKEPNKIRPLIGYVPQRNITLDPNLTVFDNLYFYSLLNLKKSKAEIHEILELFNLDSFKNKYTYQLSGGMTRKLILARLGLGDSKLIFLDEPTVGIDVFGKAVFGEYLHSIQEELDTNIIITTHDLVEAENLCDQIIFIDKGRLLDNITVSDIKGKYVKKVMIKFIDGIGIEKIKNLSFIDADSIVVQSADTVSFLLKEKTKSYSELISILEKISLIDNIIIDDISIEDYFKTLMNCR